MSAGVNLGGGEGPLSQQEMAVVLKLGRTEGDPARQFILAEFIGFMVGQMVEQVGDEGDREPTNVARLAVNTAYNFEEAASADVWPAHISGPTYFHGAIQEWLATDATEGITWEGMTIKEYLEDASVPSPSTVPRMRAPAPVGGLDG